MRPPQSRTRKSLSRRQTENFGVQALSCSGLLLLSSSACNENPHHQHKHKQPPSLLQSNRTTLHLSPLQTQSSPPSVITTTLRHCHTTVLPPPTSSLHDQTTTTSRTPSLSYCVPASPSAHAYIHHLYNPHHLTSTNPFPRNPLLTSARPAPKTAGSWGCKRFIYSCLAESHGLRRSRRVVTTPAQPYPVLDVATQPHHHLRPPTPSPPPTPPAHNTQTPSPPPPPLLNLPRRDR